MGMANDKNPLGKAHSIFSGRGGCGRSPRFEMCGESVWVIFERIALRNDAVISLLSTKNKGDGCLML